MLKMEGEGGGPGVLASFAGNVHRLVAAQYRSLATDVATNMRLHFATNARQPPEVRDLKRFHDASVCC